METLSQQDVRGIASEVISHLQNACMDYASALPDYSLDDQWRGKVAEAKKSGVIDLQGWLADELYNDVDTLCDLSGDYIYDKCSGDYGNMIRVAAEIRKDRGSYHALRKAMSHHIKRWRDHAGSIGNLLNRMDKYSTAIWGIPLTEAFESEKCVSCGIQFNNPPEDFFTTGLCGGCKTLIQLRDRKE